MRRNHFVFAFRALLALGVALAFLLPAAALLRRAGSGAYPVPLDDVYIYFDFARSTARGCVLCWTEDTGFSTGATSPPYALVLAAGWAVGFRGWALGLFATIVAIVSLIDLFRSLEALAPEPRPLVWIAPVVLVGVPLLDWSWVSGMETAFAGAILGRALVATKRCWMSPPVQRPRAQRRAGLLLFLLAWSRPECLPLAFALAVAVVHGAGTTPLLASLARAAGPLVVGSAGWAALARAMTGEWAAAGAIRKLIMTDPYASTLDMAGVWVRNVLRVGTEGVDVALGGAPSTLVVLALCAASVLGRDTRRLGVALSWGAVTSFALVCLNTTAPFQNLRYIAPTLICLLIGAVLGLAWSWRVHRWAGLASTAALGLALASAERALPAQIDHFARASRNIAEQQVSVGLRLRAMGARRVLVGDAGAIPYVSELGAIDGLGLGGYHDLPFARASVHGVPAVIELVERLPQAERPDTLAIYDAWWPGLGERFGRRAFAVKIADNVICGGDEKVVYHADWSLLDQPGATHAGSIDAIDVGDLVDEREHELRFTQPKGGFVIDAVKRRADGAPGWDAGRQLASGQHLTFTVRSSGPVAGARLVVSTDEPPAGSVEHRGASIPIPDVSPSEAWIEVAIPIGDVGPGDRITLRAERSGLRVFTLALRGDSP